MIPCSQQARTEQQSCRLVSRAVLIGLLLLVGPALAAPLDLTPDIGTTSVVRRGGGRQLRWDPKWRRFGFSDYLLSGISVGTAITMSVIGPRFTRWRGSFYGDDSVRDALRLDDLDDRRLARDISDVLLIALTSYPLVIDSIAVAGWYRDSYDVAKQMFLITAEVFAVTAAVQSIVKSLTSRERPFGDVCGTERPASTRDCDSNHRYLSFYSGHTAQAFASAAVTCSHHMNLDLYGGGATELVPCFAGLSLAAATGVMRIMGDQHYLSDVGLGALVGTAIGFGLPWLLHYRDGARRERSGSVAIVPNGLGGGVVGVF